MSLFAQLFGQKKKTVQEMQREWKSNLRAEKRKLDRQIRNIQTAEKKTATEAKAAAKKGDNEVVKLLAREIVQSRKAVSRCYAAQARLNSVMMALDQQVSQLKLAGAMKQSAEIMQDMNRLVKVDEISTTMMEMQKEMMKAGIIAEQIDDAVDNVLDEDMDSDEADEEVNKIIDDVMSSALKGTNAPMSKLQKEKEKDLEDDETDALEGRLNALKS
eukprot:TRINITY_DN23667_c0_g1_i1.p1 TRINITY_DN23667_c0_g1~~TRINITY_DN23667_c0_g1_i1.p1  ORF type:complete len:216 (+),score=75.71 TRINITY_DN23667_c0_g1_i1:86-733(+)